jgi:hypothetical protein
MLHKRVNQRFSRFPINGKKAQIGATLNWVGAVIIILFIMFIFIVLTGWLAKDKSNQIDITGREGLLSLRTFNVLMDSRVKDVCPQNYFLLENAKFSCKGDEIMKWCFLEIAQDFRANSHPARTEREEFMNCLREYIDSVKREENAKTVGLAFKWGTGPTNHLFQIDFIEKSLPLTTRIYRLEKDVIVYWRASHLT